jgi:hypothetical protein
MTVKWNDNGVDVVVWPRKRWAVDWLTSAGYRSGRSRSFWTRRGAEAYAGVLWRIGAAPRVQRLP